MPRLYVAFDDPKDALPRYFKAQLEAMGGGFVMVITGGRGKKTGAGKTHTGARIGELIDPLFNVKKIAIDPLQILKGLKEIEDSAKPNQVFIIDETEISASNKNWQSTNNKLLGFSMAIVRNLKCIIILITPNLSSIDSSLRKLIAYWGYTTKEKDLTGKVGVYLYLYEVKTDLVTGKIFFNKLRFYDRKNHRVVIMKKFKVSRVSPEMSKQLKAQDDDFKSKLRSQFIGMAEKFMKKQFDSENVNVNMDYQRVAGEIYDNPMIREYLNTNNVVTPAVLLANYKELNITQAKTLASVVNVFHKRDSNAARD